MLTATHPATAYRRIEFDARVAGADPRQLVLLCYERLLGGLDRALHAGQRNDNTAKSSALTEALAAITALQLGVNRLHPLAAALDQLYGAAREAVLGSVVAFDSVALNRLRGDIAEVAQGLTATG